jgi:cysteine-rich repeat protein
MMSLAVAATSAVAAQPAAPKSRAVPPARMAASKPATRAVAAASFVPTDLTGVVTPFDLAYSLVGPGVTISNVTFTGAPIAAGTFAGGAGIISFPSGIILSSGNIANVVGPNQTDGVTGDNQLSGDANLDTLTSGYPTLDATVLEFDFVPNAASVYFEYVFGSDEYNEWVNSPYNDVFAFYINGQNCAMVGAPPVPVSVNTINDGNPFGTGGPNSNLFINNEIGTSGTPLNTEMDGVTQTLICQSVVQANQPNHIKLAIADASDHILDSNVFIRGGSFSTIPPEVCDDGVDNDGDGSIDCTDPECSSSSYCESPTCGNGTVDYGEQCDDGNNENGDGCRADCTLESCGDGVLDPGEQCDPEIPGAGDDCRDDCTLGVCGDGFLDPEEDCDDGNLENGDGCSSSCLVEEPESACNDGLDDDSDGLIDCFDPDCASDGDCEGVELCYDGADNDGDGAADCADGDCAAFPGCELPPLEDCGNGLDDDGDGATDCSDADCAAFPACGCSDADGDGYGSPASVHCDHAELDCNDANADINPGKAEIPGNGLDDDCNAATPGACTPKLAEAGVAGGTSNAGNVDLGFYLIPGAALVVAFRRMRAGFRRA